MRPRRRAADRSDGRRRAGRRAGRGRSSRCSPTGPPAVRRRASKAVEEVFAQQHPGIEIQSTRSSRAALASTPMPSWRPAWPVAIRPDTFQIHGGAELIDNWVKTNDFTQSLADFYASRGPGRQVPARASSTSSAYEGVPYSVPVGVHRNGVLWTNKAIFDEQRPRGADRLGRVLRGRRHAQGRRRHAARARRQGRLDGRQPVRADPAGPARRRGLPRHLGRHRALDRRARHGTPSRPSARSSTTSTTTTATLTWDQAAQLIVDGKAAFNVMGDWAKGYFTSQRAGARTWASAGRPVPGHRWHLHGGDGHVRACRSDAANPENAIAWLDDARVGRGAGRVQPPEGLHPGARRCGPLQVRRVLDGGHGRLRDR